MQLVRLALQRNGSILVRNFLPNTTLYCALENCFSLSNSLFGIALFLAGWNGFAEDYQWQRAIRAGGTGTDVGSRICVTPGGALYVAGTFSHRADFGTNTLESVGGQDIFLAKLDSDEKFQWVRQIGSLNEIGLNHDSTIGLALNSDGGVYLCGRLLGTNAVDQGATNSIRGPGFFVASFNSDGQVDWTYFQSKEGEQARAIAADTEGNVYLAGLIITNITGLDQPQGRFVRKLDKAGSIVWTATENSSAFVSISAIAVSQSGEALVTGTFSWQMQYGTNLLSALGAGDLYLAKYDAGGELLWAIRAGGQEANFSDQATDLAVDREGNAILTGTLGQLVPGAGYGQFVAKFDSRGQMVWANQTGGAAGNNGTCIGLDASNNVYVAGYFFRQADFGTNHIYSKGYTDLFVAKYDAVGNNMWVRQAGGNWDFNLSSYPQDVPYGLAVGAEGDVYLTGIFLGQTHIGDFELASEGLEDIVIARLGVSPLIKSQSASQAVLLGQSVTLAVGATGSGPLTYQWFKDTSPINAATNATYVIANVQTNDSGIYVVTVANEFGNVTSTPATLTVNTEGIAINLYAGVTIVGEVGKSYQIRYTTNLSQPTWVPLTNVTLTAPIQLWFDPDPAARERRFYSVSLVP